MKRLYKFHAYVGRMGELEGVFIATQDQVDWLTSINKSIYFGEVLGKHSEIFFPIEEKHIKLISSDENVIKVVEENGLTSGYDPFGYNFIDDDTIELLGDRYEDDLCAEEVYNMLH